MIRISPNVWLGMLLFIGPALRCAGYFRVISRVALESRKFFPEFLRYFLLPPETRPPRKATARQAPAATKMPSHYYPSRGIPARPRTSAAYYTWLDSSSCLPRNKTAGPHQKARPL